MARPVDERSPIALLEDAAHLLRRMPADTLLCHWVGSAPLALFLLVFWNEVTHPPVADAAVAAEALAAALLLVWMNCWRSIFAGRLDRALSGTPDRAWDTARVRRLIVNQTFLAATKLIVLPLSFIAVFPFAGAISFYRSATSLSDRADMDALAVMAQARKLAGGDVFRGWLLQFLLLLLSLVTMANLAATFILLPQLVRMLTGFESAFTRSGQSFFENRLFLLAVMAATWLVFDPFVQAVYAVQCFERESAETGADVRAGLRRIAAAVAVGAMLWAAAPARAADAVAPQDLERSVRQTMQAPEYNWRIPPPPASQTSQPWIIAATDRAIQALKSAVRWIGRMFDRLLRWIFGGIGLSPMPAGGQAPATALHWSVWMLIAVAAGLVAWVAWRAFALRRRKPATIGHPTAVAVRLDDEGVTADRLPENEWIEMAERCLAEGNLRLALRAYYLANLAWLGRAQFLTIQAGRTNREFEVELRRKARRSPEARQLFAANVRAFERAWYGLHDVLDDDTREFRRRIDEMKSLLSEEVAA